MVILDVTVRRDLEDRAGKASAVRSIREKRARKKIKASLNAIRRSVNIKDLLDDIDSIVEEEM